MNPTLITKRPWRRTNIFYSLAAVVGAVLFFGIFGVIPEPPSLVTNIDFAYFFYSRGFGWVVGVLNEAIRFATFLPILLSLLCLALSGYFAIRALRTEQRPLVRIPLVSLTTVVAIAVFTFLVIPVIVSLIEGF